MQSVPKRQIEVEQHRTPTVERTADVPEVNVKPQRDTALIIALMILATVVRLDFMRGTQWSIDADEAIVGLMGKHILEGRGIPTFYYGQHYMGSLEALLASVSFSVFGITPFALSLVPLVCAVSLVPLMYALASALGGRAAGRVAALLMAFPPSALIIWSTKARGGFIEVLVLGAIALLITVKWYQGRTERLRYPLLLGAVLGLGWWVNNQILYFILPIALFSLLVIVRDLVQSKLRISQALAIAAVGTASFFVASSPYWIYNIRLGWPSMGMFGLAEPEAMVRQREGLFRTALPILMGATRFWGSGEIFPRAVSTVYLLYGFVLATLLVVRRRQVAGLLLGRVDRQSPVELVLLVIPVCCTIFTISTYGWLVQAPRYLLPAYVSLFAVTGVAVAYISRRSRMLATLLVVLLVGMNGASAYLKGRAVAGEPIVFNGERVARDHTKLIAALDELGITYVRTNYWIGYRLAFETQERITFSMFQEPHHVRIVEYERNMTPPEREKVPLVLVPSEARLVKRALQVAGIPFSERDIGEYTIIYNIQPPTRSGHILPREVIAKVSASGMQAAANAVDGDVTTRWGSGGPQSPGMFYRVEFASPVRMSGVEYDIGLWPHDAPRGLTIEVVRANGARETVLDDEHYEAFRYLYRMNGGFRFDFSPREVTEVIFTQEGNDPRMDWSIGELFFITPDGTNP